MTSAILPTPCAILLLGCLMLESQAQGPALRAHRWSGTQSVPDPVACSVDDQGRVYVTVTRRRKSADLDIREWTEWIPADLALEHIDQKRAFLQEQLAPGRLRGPRGSLVDANKDGSVDWQDLTVDTERILLLRDRDSDGTSDVTMEFATGFQTEVTGIAAGVLAAGGAVYSTIAPDLWQLRDTNDDGVSDERRSLVHGFGHHIAYAGHDMHGLILGPDGRLYWTIGDKGVHVKAADGSSIAKPHEGCVLRCETDGSGFEIFAHGLRNVQEIAFDDFGNLFGVDNDADKPGEKERLVYILQDSDSGWRAAWQYHEAWNPWMEEGRWNLPHADQPLFLTPPIALSHDGPSGFVFQPGTALAEEWKGWFFLNLFPSGKMRALRLEPAAGASFRLAEDVEVSTGIMGIGMSWGPDGGLFMADWDGGYPLDGKGAIYRLDVAAEKAHPLRREVRERLAAGPAAELPEVLVQWLSYPDARIRNRAQQELVRRKSWPVLEQAILSAGSPQLARVHGVQGLGQAWRSRQWTNPELVMKCLTDPDSEIRRQAARICGDTLGLEAVVQSALIAAIKDTDPRVRLYAALAAGRQKISAAVPALLEMASTTARQESFLRHAIVHGLSGCATPATLAGLAGDNHPEVRLAACLALARQGQPEVTRFLADPDPAIAAEAAGAIHDDPGIPAALSALAALLEVPSRPMATRALRRVLNANFRLGTPEAAGRLIQYALTNASKESLQEKESAVEALTLLQLWLQPPALDRVDGRPRTYPSRDPAPVRALLEKNLPALMALPDAVQRIPVLQITGQFQLDVPASYLSQSVLDAGTPLPVRSQGLRLLASQHRESPEFFKSLTTLLGPGQPSLLRREALQFQVALDPVAGIMTAQEMLTHGQPAEQQAAVLQLAAARHPFADTILLRLLTPAGDASTSAAFLRLEILEAAAQRAPEAPQIAAILTKREAALAADPDPLARVRHCATGGDPETGKHLALNHLAANCVACHRFQSGAGSQVGPPLEKIGQDRTPESLLESLVNPSAVISPGFGLSLIQLRDGTSVSGNIAGETPTTLTVLQPDGMRREIALTEVSSRTPPISVMPPMYGILTPRELRDVTAYLASLKPKTKSPKPPGAH